MSTVLRGLAAPVREIVREFPSLTLEYGARHAKARNPISSDFVCLPCSPSGSRWAQNLRAQLRRLARTGRGLIAHRKGT